MKRWVSLVLSALLLLGPGVPALAETAPMESADARLARVTQIVKETLDLDTEQYGEFQGEVYEEALGSVWNLYWTGNGATLNVEALDGGTVVGYWRNASTPAGYGYTLPTLPKADAQAAKRAAKAFLDRVLDKTAESVKLETPQNAGQLSLGSTYTRFSGNILLNGLPSPLTWSVSVSGSGNTVDSFYRDAAATAFIGGIPSATPAVAKDSAGAKLKNTLKLELIYVTDENDAARAVLRYVPTGYETVYVDAQTGELVTPADEVFFANASGSSSAPSADTAAAEDGGARKQLSEAELAGAAKLEGVLDRDALDKAVRTESAYQLDKLKLNLASANYYIVKEGADERESVLCTLRYASADDDYAAARTFNVDARTGQVRSLYSYGRWNKDLKSKVTVSAAQKTATDFLKRFTAYANTLELYDTVDDTADGAPSYAFRFARKVNGYFYPENACTVSVDRMTGAVCGVDFHYDETVKFDTAAGIVGAEAALDAWFDTYDVTLGYRYLPKELSAAVPLEAKLIDEGWVRFRTLFLSYGLERDEYCPGIDAKSGKPVEVPETDNTLAYEDTAGHWAKKEIETLADYGVGYAGGSFGPDRALTQWELVCLLASTRGGRCDPENATAEERDSAYRAVYRMGALTPDERSDGAAVERMELVRVLLNSAGYGPVARLKGIYTCACPDAASIPAEHLGYAALAQGFGLVSGAYDAHARATRAVAAVMLCRLMEREA